MKLATNKLFDVMADDGRYVLSSGPIRFYNVEADRHRHKHLVGKPEGLWYACGAAWLEWTLSEQPDWTTEYKYLYSVEITDTVLRLETEDAVRAFDKKYSESRSALRQEHRLRGFMERHEYIDWREVSEHSDGIEICPYQYELRFGFKMWYYGWDIASGCIWNERGISSLEIVASRENPKERWDVR